MNDENALVAARRRRLARSLRNFFDPYRGPAATKRGERGRWRMRRVEAADPSLAVGALNLVPEVPATFGANFMMQALKTCSKTSPLLKFTDSLRDYTTSASRRERATRKRRSS